MLGKIEDSKLKEMIREFIGQLSVYENIDIRYKEESEWKLSEVFEITIKTIK